MLDKSNVSFLKLSDYAKDAAFIAINKKLPKDELKFAKNQYGNPDVSIFDFTSLYQSVNSSRFIEKNGKLLLVSLVGDSLIEV